MQTLTAPLWRIEFMLTGETQWMQNFTTFPSKEAAERFGEELIEKWGSVEAFQVIPAETT